MKNLLIGLMTILSATAFAADCSFKITQNHNVIDCDSTMGRNCYTLNASSFEAMSQALRSKGYSLQIANVAQEADLEIDLSVATKYLPQFRGIGFVSVKYSDNVRKENGTVVKKTKEVARKRVTKKLKKLIRDLPAVLSSLVKECI